MRTIKTFEAYGEPEAGEGKQFKVIKKGKGVMPSTFTPEMISSMWSEMLVAKDFDGVALSAFLKNSKLRDSWENNNLKLTCVQEDNDPAPIRQDNFLQRPNQTSNNPVTDQFGVTVTGAVSKRESTFKLNGEDILKTYNAKYGEDGLEAFINSASQGEKWQSKNIVIVKL